MPELLELLFQLLIEGLFEGLDCAEYWRLYAPLAAGVVGAIVLHSFAPHEVPQFILCVLSVTTGIITGLVWQGGKA